VDPTVPAGGKDGTTASTVTTIIGCFGKDDDWRNPSRRKGEGIDKGIGLW